MRSIIFLFILLVQTPNLRGQEKSVRINDYYREYSKCYESLVRSFNSFLDHFPKDFCDLECLYSYNGHLYDQTEKHFAVLNFHKRDSTCAHRIISLSVNANRFPDAGGDLWELLRSVLILNEPATPKILMELKDWELISVFVFLEDDVLVNRRLPIYLVEFYKRSYPKIFECYNQALGQIDR